MPNKQIPRVKLTLNKYISTWEGKVLRYLHDHHPSKRNAAGMVMDLSSAAWLPYAMRSFGASESECREAALYSARFLLSHACSIASEFGLPKVEMQGLLGDSISPGFLAAASSTVDVNTALEIEEPDIEDGELEDDEDEGMLSFSGLDAGFRT